MVAEERLLAPCRPACAADADDVFVTLGPDDEDQAATDGSDGDEPIFEFGVSFVEGDAVLFLVREVFFMVPGDLTGAV